MTDSVAGSERYPQPEGRLGEVEAFIRRLVIAVLWGLLLASLLVPIARNVPEDSDDEQLTLTYFGALGHLSGIDLPDLGSLEAHPYAIPGGRALTIAGLVMIGIAVVAAVLTSVVLRGAATRGFWIAAGLAAGGLVIGPVICWFGLVWLPESNEVSAPGWGLLFPLAAGLWLTHGLWSVHRLD